MSIASQITRLQNIKTAIKNALVTKGVPATDHDMEDFPQDIMSIATQGIYQSKTVSPTTTQQVVLPDSGYDALVSVTVNGIQLQSKSVTPSGTAQTVTPDNDKDGLSSVSVDAIQTQTKSATPTTSAQTITPDSGKYLTSVSVGAIQTQTKSATPTTSAQTITPDSGKYLSSVSVSAIQTQTKSATPSTTAQTITPDSGKYLSSVSVDAVQLQNKSVTPTSSSQIVTADSGYIGLNQVTVGASTGIDTSDATAYAANVVSPYTFYARGNKYTGSITPRSLTTGSNLGYSRIDSGYYSNSYSVSANSPIFESVYMSSSRQTSLTSTYSVSQSPSDLTMVVLSTTDTDYTEDILQTTGGNAQGILAIGFIPSIDVMYVEFELRFSVSGTSYTATVSYSSGQYTVTLNSLPSSSYRPYFQVYRVMNKGFSLS